MNLPPSLTLHFSIFFQDFFAVAIISTGIIYSLKTSLLITANPYSHSFLFILMFLFNLNYSLYLLSDLICTR